MGVSFGLPNQQAANQYAGQPQNFLGTGPGVNPYPASGGISLGAVDINPLVSFQATTNDNGEIVNKPLINLHVTPNGCGVFGCNDEFEPSFPEFFAGNRRQQNKNNFQYEQLTPTTNPHQNYQSQYDYQYQQQQEYNRRQQYNQQRPYHPPSNQHGYSAPPPKRLLRPSSSANRVRFGNDQDNDQVVIKHEHHHYHHNQQQDRYKESGISFGYHPQEMQRPYFRTLDSETEEDSSSNQVKRKVNNQSTGEGDKDGFQFPQSRQLDKRSAIEEEPAIAPAKDIQPVCYE